MFSYVSQSLPSVLLSTSNHFVHSHSSWQTDMVGDDVGVVIFDQYSVVEVVYAVVGGDVVIWVVEQG